MRNNIITTKLNVNDNEIKILHVGNIDYISLTDLAKYSNPEYPANVIIHWLSNKSTVDFMGLWEQLNNPNFNLTEFREIKSKEVGYNSFTMSPTRWIKTTNAIGLISKGGKYSLGTFAHPDIAFEFASWLSPEFKLYLITEFERLKTNESYQYKIDWHANRILAKVSYILQTDAIKNIIIPTLSENQKQYIYANEADVLNVALFGITAREWREQNPELAKTGNIRDYTDLIHLVILNNLENINSQLIKDGLSQKERLIKLNSIAQDQMQILQKNKSIASLENFEKNINNKTLLEEQK